MTASVVRNGRASPVLWILLVAIVGAVFVIGFFSQDDGLDDAGSFADPTGTGLEGLLGLRLFVEEAGGEALLDVGLPDESVDVAILALPGNRPLLSEEGNDFVTSWVPLLEWVEDGGVLVTSIDVAAGPQLQLTSIDGDEFAVPGTCTISDLAGVQEVRTLEYSPGTVEPGDTSCFGDSETALVVARDLGEGQIIRLATMAPLMNRSLDDADNGALAARLLDIGEAPTVGFLPGAPIFFEPAEGVDSDNIGDPENNGEQVRRDGAGNALEFTGGDLTPLDEDGNPVGTGSQTLWQLISLEVKVLLAGLTFAALIYVAAVARRLGNPVIEPLPIELPSSSYVDAVGRLYARTPESIARSSQILRSDLRTDLARRVGLPSTATALELASAASGSTDREQLESALDGPTPKSDEEFVVLAKELIEIRQRVERGTTSRQTQSSDDSFVHERTTSG